MVNENIIGYNELGVFLKDKRLKAKMSYRGFERLSGVDRRTLIDLEKGNPISLNSLNSILIFFNVKIQISLKL